MHPHACFGTLTLRRVGFSQFGRSSLYAKARLPLFASVVVIVPFSDAFLASEGAFNLLKACLFKEVGSEFGTILMRPLNFVGSLMNVFIFELFGYEFGRS